VTPLTVEPTLAAVTRAAAETWPDRVALVFDETGEHLTFAEVERRSNAVANALRELGIRAGDTVAVMLRNRAEFPVSWLGIAKLGAAIVPLNVFYRREDAHYLLADSGAKAVITADEFAPLLGSLDRTGLALQHVLSVDGNGGGSAADFAALCAAAAVEPPPVIVLPEHLANIQYTSGTTGKPKGCMLSNFCWVSSMRSLVEDNPGFGQHDVLLTAQPFYYADPQWNTLVGLLSGARVVVLDRFHPSSFWGKVQEYETTVFYCLGVMPQLLFKMPAEPDEREHKLRLVLCSAIPPNLHRVRGLRHERDRLGGHRTAGRP
jgi:crotonobetaine/carnitine-CoA ligase